MSFREIFSCFLYLRLYIFVADPGFAEVKGLVKSVVIADGILRLLQSFLGKIKRVPVMGGEQEVPCGNRVVSLFKYISKGIEIAL